MLTHVDLFSGIGGFALAAGWAGFDTIVFCEKDEYCQKVLKKRFPGVPIIPEIREFLDYWGIDICEIKDRERQTCETFDLHKKPKKREELLSSAKIVEQKSLFPQALQNEGESSVLGNAELNLCEEKTDLPLEAGLGCEAREIQTGKMEKDMNVAFVTKCQKSINGEGEFMQGMATPARNAGRNRKARTNSGRTTLKNGRSIQNYDLKSRMESRSANSAIIKSTEGMKIDILTAGIPCQPASCAGKQRGPNDSRWLWPEAFAVIQHLKPTWCLLENVCGLLSLEGGVVFENLLIELEAQGYEVQTFIIPACAVEAKHRRDRVWIVAYATERAIGDGGRIALGTKNKGRERAKTGREALCSGKEASFGSNARSSSQIMANTQGGEPREQTEQKGREGSCGGSQEVGRIMGNTQCAPKKPISEASRSRNTISESSQWPVEPQLGGMVDGFSRWLDEPRDIPRVARGVKDRVNRLKALGNAIVPQVACEIMRTIREIEEKNG